ncbi:hypothetical protein NUW54_g9022 [Trametes sanguinea]|uniref:Uncharacterized protein n=1 Tax=Trametes sanguinea TaxID=158606 RepID=A0ACC1PA31_9APHY|nr:hypothetical protein NUW54_g9022 [Trametes sanguinea]
MHSNSELDCQCMRRPVIVRFRLSLAFRPFNIYRSAPLLCQCSAVVSRIRTPSPTGLQDGLETHRPENIAFSHPSHWTSRSSIILKTLKSNKRLLTNFDIMALVFEHFAPEYPDGHSLFHHAAGALWGAHMGEHCGLQHLLSIMDLCNIGEEVFQPNAAGLVTRDNAAFARGVVWHPCWNHFMYYAGLIKSMRVNAAELQPGMIALLSSFVPDDSSILCWLRQLYWEECGHGDKLLYIAGGALQVLSIVVLDPQDDYMTERVFADWVERLCNKLVCLSPQG